MRGCCVLFFIINIRKRKSVTKIRIIPKLESTFNDKKITNIDIKIGSKIL